MTRLVCSAPGKALISGEYAVLRGAPAICMAVARRARVTVNAIAGSSCRVSAPGFIDGEFEFSSADGKITWHQAAAAKDFGLLQAAWELVFAGGNEPPALALELDTREFHDAATGAKLGLGSSAALAVAVVVALAKIAGRSDDALMLAHEAHAKFQRQQGSGVDVAASATGGLICYKTDARLEPELLEWPAGLNYRFVWTGRPVATTDKLQQFAAVSDGVPELAVLAEHAKSVADAFAAGAANEVLAAVSHYARALQRFDAASGLGIFANEHEWVSEAATRHGLCYKPCGAGGGDIGVVLYSAGASLETLEEDLQGSGVELLPLRMDRAGPAIAKE